MEWVSTNELMNALGAPAVRTGSDVAYRACKRAHEGLLRTRAKAFFKGNEEFGSCDLPKEFWWAEGHAALDQDWTSGDFATSGPEARRTAWMADGPVREWRAYGVQWCMEDAQEMGARFGQTANETGGRGKGGLKPDSARWQAFYFAVITLAQEGRLTKDSFESRAALSEEILTLCPSSGHLALWLA